MAIQNHRDTIESVIVGRSSDSRHTILQTTILSSNVSDRYTLVNYRLANVQFSLFVTLGLDTVGINFDWRGHIFQGQV